MKEDNATYSLCLYQNGQLMQIVRHLSFREAFEIYHKHNPFTQMCVDVYRDGERLTFGEAMDLFADSSRFVKVF